MSQSSTKIIVKRLLAPLIKYFGIFVPMGVLIIFFTFWLGELLGVLLIGYLGDSLGLFVRPVLISGIVILLLYGLRMPLLVKTNQLIWFKCFTAEQINAIYRQYIYGVGTFTFLTTLVVLNTYFALISSITWFNSSDYLLGYLLILLVVIPVFCFKNNQVIQRQSK
jgi:hypothetical protein